MSFEARAIAEWKTWAPGLRTLRLEGPALDFEPGQFVRLALPEQPDLARSYSLSSAPGQPLETFLVEVPGGELTPKLFALAPGEEVLVDTVPQGHFVLGRVPPAPEVWLIATGTGLGPYVSMLRAESIWTRTETLVVVHGVRERTHLAYREELTARAAELGRDLRWISVVSREDPPPTGVSGRITTALESGLLEARADLSLSPSRSHVLLCGNPGLIRDLRGLLEARGLERNRPRRPGHFTSEKYW